MKRKPAKLTAAAKRRYKTTERAKRQAEGKAMTAAGKKNVTFVVDVALWDRFMAVRCADEKRNAVLARIIEDAIAEGPPEPDEDEDALAPTEPQTASIVDQVQRGIPFGVAVDQAGVNRIDASCWLSQGERDPQGMAGDFRKRLLAAGQVWAKTKAAGATA